MIYSDLITVSAVAAVVAVCGREGDLSFLPVGEGGLLAPLLQQLVRGQQSIVVLLLDQVQHHIPVAELVSGCRGGGDERVEVGAWAVAEMRPKQC